MREYIVHTRKSSSVLLAYRCCGWQLSLRASLAIAFPEHFVRYFLSNESLQKSWSKEDLRLLSFLDYQVQIDYGGAFVQISAFIMLQVSSILSATVMRNLMLSAIELSTVRLQLYLSEVSTLAESSVLVERDYRHPIPAFVSSTLYVAHPHCESEQLSLNASCILTSMPQ